jgi:hypothetical protein
MLSGRWRAAIIGPAFVIAVGISSMATVSVGTAQAARVGGYTNTLFGPISSQSTCATQAAALNDPPDDWTSACRFETDYPGTSTPDPGWYFNFHTLITP